MTVRPRWTHGTRHISRRAGAVAGASLAFAFALPALASPPHQVLCSEADAPTLAVTVEQLSSTLDDTHILVPADYTDEASQDDTIVVRKALLEPRAKAAIREVFDDLADTQSVDTAAADEIAEDDAEETPKPRAMNTKLPGVSEERLDRFKRQMYRRDI